MTRQEKARRCERQGQGKFAYTEKYNPDLQNRQSPWTNLPNFDPLAEVVRLSQADAERLEATCDDDIAWFDANPIRRFHIRNATPHERDTGLACGWMMVARCSIGRIRLPVPFPALAAHDASEHDIEEKARDLFDCLTWNWAAKNTPPAVFVLIEEIRGAR